MSCISASYQVIIVTAELSWAIQVILPKGNSQFQNWLLSRGEGPETLTLALDVLNKRYYKRDWALKPVNHVTKSLMLVSELYFIYLELDTAQSFSSLVDKQLSDTSYSLNDTSSALGKLESVTDGALMSVINIP